MMRRMWVLLVVCGCATTGPAVKASRAPCRAYVGGTVIAAPGAEPVRDGVVLFCGTTLTAVGAKVDLPAGTERIDARGTTLVAGFWNSHVHLTEAAFAGSASAPAPALADALEDLTTRWGFVHVVDLGSDPRSSAALRARVRQGEVRGPEILHAAGPFIPPGGQPKYVPVPLPELTSPEQATATVEGALGRGADAIKLMTASVVAHPPSPVMALPVVQAVTKAAHAHGALVFAHPTNRAGVEVAREGGVDVLAHTAPEDGPWTAEDTQALVHAKVSLIPTLSLWRRELAGLPPSISERFEQTAIEQVRRFHEAGGTLLFGTDAGYRPEHDPTLEYELLGRAGLSWTDQLAMLTTLPAARLGAKTTGRLEPGLDADLVVLEGDLTADPLALSKVRCARRQGQLVHGSAACGL